MSFATGMMIGMASRGGGGGIDLSILTFKDVCKGLLVGFSMFFIVYMVVLDSFEIKSNKDMYGTTYSRNIVILSHGMSSRVEVGLNSGIVTNYSGNISIKTKSDGIVHFSGYIEGEEYNNLIKYLSEGCSISYFSNANPIKVRGVFFKLYYWRLKTIGF